MRPQLASIATHQGGLVTRKQAIDSGYRERELRTLTAVRGPWVAVRRGVYVEREMWDVLDTASQWALRDRAAHLLMTRDHVLSHDSAARLLGLDTLTAKWAVSHVTRPGVGGSRTEHGVKHHLSRLAPQELVEVEGIQVTGLARTALDVGREHGFEAGVVAVDGALRRGASPGQFEAELETMTCWPHISRARAAYEFGDAGAESLGESMARILVGELGVGEPTTQFPVRTASGVVWCDLRVGCHLFEFDGRVKYRRADEGGVATEPLEDVLWREKKRQNDVCAVGLGMSRIVWDDFYGAARQAAKQRLRSEYAVTLRRFGAELPEHLAVFERQMRGRRRAS